jgi:hypothetical protein
MTHPSAPRESPPVDIEAIIAEIRKNNTRVEPKEEAAVEAPPDMFADFKVACDIYSGGQWPSGGIKALFRKAIYRLLGLKDFNGRIVSTMTRIISVINGTELPPNSSVILTNQRRMIDMLTQLYGRMDKQDDENLAARLSALEKELKQKPGSENQ